MRYFGNLILQKTSDKIGHHYPNLTITKDIIDRQPELKKYLNRDLTPIAWLWTRTVPTPNPAFQGLYTPLMKSFSISKKKNKERWIKPIINNGKITFEVNSGIPPDEYSTGLKDRIGAKCIFSGSPISQEYIRECGKRTYVGTNYLRRITRRPRRVYVSIDGLQIESLPKKRVSGVISGNVPKRLTGGTCYGFGFTEFESLYSDRQILFWTLS